MAGERTEGLSVVIPAYNEHQGIEPAVAGALECLRARAVPFELIVVDDGSTDGTGEILRRGFSGQESVRLLSKPCNGGFGAALRAGIEIATMPFVTFFPVDNPLTAPVLDSLLAARGRADVLVGFRPARVGYTASMRLKSRLFERVVSAVFGLTLRDYNWIHVYPRKVFAPQGSLRIESDGVFSLAEILIKCRDLGLTFHELPVPMRGRDYGVKTAATLKAAVRTALEFAAFLRRRAARPRPAATPREAARAH